MKMEQTNPATGESVLADVGSQSGQPAGTIAEPNRVQGQVDGVAQKSEAAESTQQPQFSQEELLANPDKLYELYQQTHGNLTELERKHAQTSHQLKVFNDKRRAELKKMREEKGDPAVSPLTLTKRQSIKDGLQKLKVDKSIAEKIVVDGEFDPEGFASVMADMLRQQAVAEDEFKSARSESSKMEEEFETRMLEFGIEKLGQSGEDAVHEFLDTADAYVNGLLLPTESEQFLRDAFIGKHYGPSVDKAHEAGFNEGVAARDRQLAASGLDIPSPGMPITGPPAVPPKFTGALDQSLHVANTEARNTKAKPNVFQR